VKISQDRKEKQRWELESRGKGGRKNTENDAIGAEGTSNKSKRGGGCGRGANETTAACGRAKKFRNRVRGGRKGRLPHGGSKSVMCKKKMSTRRFGKDGLRGGVLGRVPCSSDKSRGRREAKNHARGNGAGHLRRELSGKQRERKVLGILLGSAGSALNTESFEGEDRVKSGDVARVLVTGRKPWTILFCGNVG